MSSKTRIRIVKVPITISMKEVDEERRKGGHQCCEPYGGRGSIRFCGRRRDHEGDHRADRVQWRTEEVPMTPVEEKRQRRVIGGLISHLVANASAKVKSA
jgi:hypothetical protein